MKIRITDVDYAPDDFYGQVPFEASLLRQVPGKDRPDYWLAELTKPLVWKNKEGNEVAVTHIVLSARYVGARIAPGVGEITVGIVHHGQFGTARCAARIQQVLLLGYRHCS